MEEMHQVLVVDDEATVRESLAMLFRSKGYEVSTATDGFDALLQLRTISPDLITSDLNMPNMSGFEFLSVIRRRFPQIPVVAISGAYECGEAVPGGIIADGFYAKGQDHPETLLATVANLIRTSASRARAHRQQSAPVWIPRNVRSWVTRSAIWTPVWRQALACGFSSTRALIGEGTTCWGTKW